MCISIRAWCLVAVCASAASAREWAWPAGSESVRIDTKVRFLDDTSSDKTKRGDVQSDEMPFRQPTTTDGFYNRPPGAGRYPVRVVADRDAQRDAYRVNGQAVYPVQANKNINDGTVDSVQYCKCVSTPDCNPRQESAEVCGAGKYLCCYKRPNKIQQINSEYFNEIDDERPMLFPGKENNVGPFPPPPSGAHAHGVGFRPGHGGEYFDFANGDSRPNKPVLVGPGGPSGNIGPPETPVLIGPEGPTGNVGPHKEDIVASEAAQRGILVGPGGPTGIIGPYNRPGLLVGPGGPTGMIGPNRSRGVLVGPGGPTGIIGPGYGRQAGGPGVLTGPGGPTGTIGQGRRLLTGPRGPTGRIGPQGYFDFKTKKLKSVKSMSPAKTKTKLVNKNGTKFSRSDGAPVHPRPAHGAPAPRTDRPARHRRLRRGSCSRGCSNNTASPPQKQKGYRVKLPNKPTRKKQRPTHKQRPTYKKSGCSRPDGGCQSATKPPLQAAAPPPTRRAMGIEEYPTKRPKTTTVAPIRKKPGLRGGGKDDKDDFKTNLKSKFSPSRTTWKTEMLQNRNGMKFYRSPAGTGTVLSHAGDVTDSPATATHRTRRARRGARAVNQRRMPRGHRGSCSRGCDNSPAAPSVPPLIQKGYRLKPNEPIRKQQTRKMSGCSRPGSGCQSVNAPIKIAVTPLARRAMGIEEYPKPQLKRPLLRKKTSIRGSNDEINDPDDSDNEGGEDFLPSLLSNVLSAYMDFGAPTPRTYTDVYTGPSITTPLSTIKPSIFRKIPIYLAFLKSIKALIVFGIL